MAFRYVSVIQGVSVSGRPRHTSLRLAGRSLYVLPLVKDQFGISLLGLVFYFGLTETYSRTFRFPETEKQKNPNYVIQR